MIFRRGAALGFSVLCCLLLFSPAAVSAGSGQSLDEVLEGFDDGGAKPMDDNLDSVLEGFDSMAPDMPASEQNRAVYTPSRFDLDGYVQLGASYNFAHESPAAGQTDWRGGSRLRTELNVDLNVRLADGWQAKVGGKGFYDAVYSVKGRDEYTEAVLDEYEDELELREAWVLGRLADNLDLKAGRQIVVWGKSDNIRVTDVLNPLDLREPGLTDIEDLRLPVAMTKLDSYFGSWNLAAMAIHELRFNKLPAYGHDFYQGQTLPPPEDKPEDNLENTEWALSLGGIFSGWDLDLYYARIFNDTPHFMSVSTGTIPAYRRQHARLHMFGLAYNRALGNWLAKTEAAWFEGLEYANDPGQSYNRADALVGFEYSGFQETVISLEFADRHVINHDPVLENGPDFVLKDMFQAALRYNRDFLHDTLTLTFLAMVFGPDEADGAFERLSLEYDLSDTVRLRGGTVLYQSGDLPVMRNIGDSDRLFLEIRYNF